MHVALTLIAAMLTAGAPGEWRSYGADDASSKHSPLGLIDAGNVDELEVVWRWTSPDDAVLEANPRLWTMPFEATPLMVGGVLYTSTSLSQAAAIDAATGETIWTHDPRAREGEPPGNLGFVHRGVAFWEDGDDRRIIYGTGDARLIALDAATGEPIVSFGDGGAVDLTLGLRRPIARRLYSVTSPPAVCGDVIVVGASIHDSPVEALMPPGDVRGFDARTGEQLWTFHTVPQAGEFGVETWGDESWRTAGNANVWPWMSYDAALGLVYLPVGSPTDDFYGGGRPGDNLFANSLIALDAQTGARRWHFQLEHHPLYDYDPPAGPNLIDVVVDGKPRKAVAQVTKQAFCFVFDRETGEPIWPIEERRTPPSYVRGERPSATQPFPTKPAPFDRQGVSMDDLIDFTPELREAAQRIVRRRTAGPLYTPPSRQGTIVLPGYVGGASWAGAAFDPGRRVLFVPSVTKPTLIRMQNPGATGADYVYPAGNGPHGPEGLPLFKPPYGRITAIDMDAGEHVWMRAIGDGPRDHPALAGLDLPQLGWDRRIFVLSTPGVLFAAQMGPMGVRPPPGLALELRARNDDPALLALDPDTGKQIAKIALPGNATGSPMTYEVGGRQFIVVAIGGAGLPAELVALALPEG